MIVPSRATSLSKLREAERLSERGRRGLTEGNSPSALISAALDLETQQCVERQRLSWDTDVWFSGRAYLHVLEHKAQEGLKADVEKSKRASERLQAKLETFDERIREVYPGLEGVPVRTADSPADVLLLLPSTFTGIELAEYDVQELRNAEAELRLGSCFDCVKKLKEGLGVRSFLTRHARHQNGYELATRSQETIRRAESNVRRWGRSYQRSWEALNALGVPVGDRGGLRELKKEDMTILGKWLEGEQYRSRGQQLPWIWTLMPIQPQDASEEGVENAVESWNREGTLRWPKPLPQN